MGCAAPSGVHLPRAPPSTGFCTRRVLALRAQPGCPSRTSRATAWTTAVHGAVAAAELAQRTVAGAVIAPTAQLQAAATPAVTPHNSQSHSEAASSGKQVSVELLVQPSGCVRVVLFAAACASRSSCPPAAKPELPAWQCEIEPELDPLEKVEPLPALPLLEVLMLSVASSPAAYSGDAASKPPQASCMARLCGCLRRLARTGCSKARELLSGSKATPSQPAPVSQPAAAERSAHEAEVVRRQAAEPVRMAEPVVVVGPVSFSSSASGPAMRPFAAQGWRALTERVSGCFKPSHGAVLGEGEEAAASKAAGEAADAEDCDVFLVVVRDATAKVPLDPGWVARRCVLRRRSSTDTSMAAA